MLNGSCSQVLIYSFASSDFIANQCLKGQNVIEQVFNKVKNVNWKKSSWKSNWGIIFQNLKVLYYNRLNDLSNANMKIEYFCN